MSAEYGTGSGFQGERITPLFALPDDIRINPTGQRFAVAPDGRFLMIRARDVVDRGHRRRRLTSCAV